jgi:hypothetical protein
MDDAADEVETERLIANYLRSILSCPELQAGLMPPGRRAWFEGFVHRSVEGALLQDRRDGLARVWKIYETTVIDDGVVPAVTEIICLANDADGKEERRGWAYTAREMERTFLKDRADIREIFESAIASKSIEIWKRYPAWYGRRNVAPNLESVVVARQRTTAVRFLPLFDQNDPLLRTLLNDDVAEIRHVAAIRLAASTPDADDQDLLDGLLNAAADREWIWSLADHFDNMRCGCHDAFLMLERFGVRAKAAAPFLKAELAKLQSDSDSESEWFGRPLLARLDNKGEQNSWKSVLMNLS